MYVALITTNCIKLHFFYRVLSPETESGGRGINMLVIDSKLTQILNEVKKNGNNSMGIQSIDP